VNAKNIFTELKRRNVYRAAVAYGVVAWFLTQLTTQVFPFFEIPNSAVRFVVIALAVGFPIAMLLAWVYEFTPEGVVRTETLDPVQTKSAQRATGRILDFVIIGVLLMVIAMLVVGRLPFYRQTGELIPQKTIAVLPFENLSRDPDNAYFADGIQDEILTRLSKIADLKVISRTSTQHYKSAPENLPEIAKQLGVAHILEGRVQRSGDTVRVNVQLIKAANDSHLWADTFDRKLTDIFSVESDIAKRIAEALRATLTGHEEQALAVKPTNNPEAYDAYLRGLAFEGREGYVNDVLIKAIGFYEQAVGLDPDFATAWARLSRADARLFAARVDTTTAVRGDAAKRALENAQKLQPNSPETLLALGYYQFSVLRDYPQAKATFDRVSKISPSNSDAPNALSLITQREGYWDQSIAYLEQALALDPRNIELLKDAAATYTMLRQFPNALNLYDRALDIAPNSPDMTASKASIYQAEGNLQQAAKLLMGINEQSPIGAFQIKVTQLRLERNYSEAVRLLQARLSQFHFSEIEKFSDIEKAFYRLHLASIQRLTGDTANAKLTAEQARTTYEQLHRDQPDKRANWAVALSHVYAAMGEKDSALKLAKSAIELLPRTKDPMLGPGFEENLALIETIFGENSRAISILTTLLQTPYIYFFQQTPVTPALLRLDPLWDPLRNDPAFQKLCEEKQP
jgi:TolB-like protein/Flp pilus assembly protein TadD